MASLVLGDHEQVVEDFYWYLLHATAANAFPGRIYYKKREAWNNTIPHVTGACNYAVMLRHMLVHEAGEELHLLAAVPDGWLAEGRRSASSGRRRISGRWTSWSAARPAACASSSRGPTPAARADRVAPAAVAAIGDCVTGR